MALSEQALNDLRETVAVSHRLLYLTGLGTTLGHTSARIPGTDTFIIKPWPHIQMHRIRAEDLIVMDFEGNTLGAGHRTDREGERMAHPRGALQARNPDLGSIIHTHQKWATMMGDSPVQPSFRSSTPELSTAPSPTSPAMFDDDKALITLSIEQGSGGLAARMKTAERLPTCRTTAWSSPARTSRPATIDAIATEHLAEMTWRAQLIGSPEAMPELVLALQPAASPGVHQPAKSPKAWEHYWKWVDANPESLRAAVSGYLEMGAPQPRHSRAGGNPRWPAGHTAKGMLRGRIAALFI